MSHHFSVKAVRLNSKISWCKGSTRLIHSSSSVGSAPGFCSKKQKNKNIKENVWDLRRNYIWTSYCEPSNLFPNKLTLGMLENMILRYLNMNWLELHFLNDYEKPNSIFHRFACLPKCYTILWFKIHIKPYKINLHVVD